ncbi:MAG: hypothetical protein PHH26_02750 [Candidatus Thermoplasmatota archaeon]|nr:hypothetical protein [Candidatus Thermoplasmatota archaeon]
MKLMNLAAIAVIGLMLATALSGCVGSKNEATSTGGMETTDTGLGENETGNQIGNATAVNQTLVVIYHDEKTDTTDTASYLASENGKDYTFPVAANAKKIVIIFKASSLPSDATGCGIWVFNANGEEVANEFSNKNTEVKIEFKESKVVKGGFGDWRVHFVPQLPDVMATYTTTIDVFGISA